MTLTSYELFEKYQKALTTASAGLWEWNLATNEIKWDRGFQKLFGFPDDAQITNSADWYKNIHPEDLKDLQGHIDLICIEKTELDAVYRVIHPDGKTLYIRSRGYPIKDKKGEIISLVGMNWDVTRESVLQKDLEETKYFLENIMNAIPDPLFVKDSGHRWIFANGEFEKLIGKNKIDFLGKSDYDFFPTELADTYWRKDQEVFENGVSNENEEKVVLPDGSVRDILTKKSAFFLSSQEKVLVGVIRDITDKNKLDSRFRLMISLIDSSADLFGFTDATGVPQYVNQTGKDVFGIEVGKHYFSDYLTPEDKELVDKEIIACLKKEERWEGEVTAVNPKTKAKVPLLLKVFAVRTGPKPTEVFYGCSGTDLSEIKKIQRSLIEQSKMASLGEMAAEIAHEVNNPLMIVQAKAQMLQSKISAEHPDRDKIIKDLQLIEKNSIRIDKIIKSLKTASRRSEQDPFELVPILVLVEEALELSRQRFRLNDISLTLDTNEVCDYSHVLYARSTEIVQVLVNLLNNSFDAVKTQKDPWVKIVLGCTSDAYKIEVVDSGTSIANDVVEKMFQPFYTTKPLGQGTGLGLSLSKQIIQNHGGDFYYDTKSVNTRFVFTLRKYDASKVIT